MIIKIDRGVVEEHMLAQAGSLGELLEQFRDQIPPVLVDGPGWDKLVERARGLPVSLGGFGFGFELPLHEREPRADLGVPLFAGSRSAAHFEEWCLSQRTDSSMKAVVPLLREMGREESDLRRVVGDKLMLEYDIDPAHRGVPPDPGIFLYTDDTPPGDGPVQRLEDVEIVANAVDAASSREPDAAERRQVERLFRAMPPDTYIGSIGAFPARPRAFRLTINGFREAHELAAFLECANWPGQPAAAAALASDLEKRGAFAHLAVHFDVQAEGVGPLLGVSCYPREARWVKDIKPWEALIDVLREQGVAVPEKLNALENSWSGAETMLGRRTLLIVVRGVHHIKLVLAGDRCEQVKAYVFVLYFTPSQVAASTA